MGDVLELTLIACTAAAKSESGVSARKLCECARMTTRVTKDDRLQQPERGISPDSELQQRVARL
jgi:hypothetical protein